jgi:hypothetical protein
MDIRKIIKEEIDDLEWAREAVSGLNINIGDVFYIIDGASGFSEPSLPDDSKPMHVRYLFYVTDIVEGKPERSLKYSVTDTMFVKYKMCNTKDVTYDKNDYGPNSNKCKGEYGDTKRSGYNHALGMIGARYWRKMK